MRKVYEDFIYLMRCTLNGESAKDFSGGDFGELFRIAQDHNMTNMLYYALQDNCSVPDEISQELQKYHDLMVYKCAYQKAAEQELSRLLNSSGLKHMFLKGGRVRALYPSEDMREMADIDVLVDISDMEHIKSALTEAGYEFEGHKGHHDVFSKKPMISVEVHETMLDHGRDTGLDDYFSDPWKLAKPNGLEYLPDINNDYIFLMGHLLGHFQQGGTGIRTVLDVGLYVEKYADEMDREYIDGVFDKYNILEVMHNIEALAKLWICGGDVSPLLDEMGEYVFGSGSYGRVSNMMMYLADEGGGKSNSVMKSIRRKLFISSSEMRRRSKIIDKCPILLPLGYIVRAFKIVFGQFRELCWWIKGMKSTDAESIKKHKEMLERFGIH